MALFIPLFYWHLFSRKPFLQTCQVLVSRSAFSSMLDLVVCPTFNSFFDQHSLWPIFL